VHLDSFSLLNMSFLNTPRLPPLQVTPRPPSPMDESLFGYVAGADDPLLPDSKCPDCDGGIRILRVHDGRGDSQKVQDFSVLLACFCLTLRSPLFTLPYQKSGNR
jgi:hypothetical protein